MKSFPLCPETHAEEIVIPDHYTVISVFFKAQGFHLPVSRSGLFLLRHLISPVSLCDSKVLSGYSLLLTAGLRQALHLQPSQLWLRTLSQDQLLV